VFSSRKLENATYDSVAFRFVAADEHPDHDTLNTFRKRFLKDIEVLMVQVLMIAHTMKVSNFGNIAFDGSKFKASASRHSALSYGHIKKLEEQLKGEVKRLMELAGAADNEKIPDGMNLPEEIACREDRIKAITEAKTKIEGRAKERFEQEQVEYQDKLNKREVKAKESGKKPRGKQPTPPVEGAQDKDQINLTDSHLTKGIRKAILWHRKTGKKTPRNTCRNSPGLGQKRTDPTDVSGRGAFVRINDVRRCRAPKAVRPLCQAMLTHEYTYAYAAVEAKSGELDSLILSYFNTDCMQLFLDEVGARHPSDKIIMVLDGAGWYSSRLLQPPQNMKLLPLPPYASELNPVEHVRDELREKHFHNRVFDSLDGLEDQLEVALRTFENNAPMVKSIVALEWIVSALLN
jgi:hypothetical protein